MPMPISSNIAKLNIENKTRHTSLDTGPNAAIQRLSSGLSIDRSGSTPAVEKPDTTAAQNRNNAVWAAQFVQSSLDHATKIINLMHEVATEFKNSVLTDDKRQAYNERFQGLRTAVLDIAAKDKKFLEDTQYGNKLIVSGQAKLDLKQSELTNSENPENGILTRSYNALSLTSADDFDLLNADEQQLQNIGQSLMEISGTIEKQIYAAAKFEYDVSSRWLNTPTEPDLGIYNPTNAQSFEYAQSASSSLAKDQIAKQMAAAALAPNNSPLVQMRAPLFV